MRASRAFTAVISAALALGPTSAPAAAGGLPPLDLKRGQGSVGIGAVSIGGDVAIDDGVAIGLLAYNSMLYWNVVTARATWTRMASPYGNLGFTVTGGAALMGGAFPGIRTAPLLVAGPVIETPPGWVRLRASLQGGLLVEPRPLYDTGEYPQFYGGPMGDPVVVANRTIYSLAVLPGIEVVVPLGENAELTLFGYNLIGFYGRW